MVWEPNLSSNKSQMQLTKYTTADTSDLCMTQWTIAKTHILNGDYNQGLKHAIKTQKYLIKMIKYALIYFHNFTQPTFLLYISSANKTFPE